mmetsp:Transcript_37851/g.126648  ORF Transcript_37851/g.126648 Transcript_37851/m.126648 type:complete len:208 (-) Transcript_37851:222-845(-)
MWPQTPAVGWRRGERHSEQSGAVRRRADSAAAAGGGGAALRSLSASPADAIARRRLRAEAAARSSASRAREERASWQSMSRPRERYGDKADPARAPCRTCAMPSGTSTSRRGARPRQKRASCSRRSASPNEPSRAARAAARGDSEERAAETSRASRRRARYGVSAPTKTAIQRRRSGSGWPVAASTHVMSQYSSPGVCVRRAVERPP